MTTTRTVSAAAQQRLTRSRQRPPVDLRPVLPAALDQGPRPLCVPVALTAAHEGLRTQHTGSAPEGLAPEPLWSACLVAGVASAGGCQVAGAADALRTDGQPALTDWPYNPTLGFGTEPPPAAAGSKPWQQAVVAERPLARDGVEEALENELAAGRPAVLILEVTAEFVHPASNGDIALGALTAPLGEAHAVLVVGAATDPQRGRQLLVRNSWGPHWGVGGVGWLQLAWVAAFGFGWASVTL